MVEQKDDNESAVEIKNGWLLISQKYSDGKIEKFSVQISNICNIFDDWRDPQTRGTFIFSCNDTHDTRGLFIQKPYEEILKLLTIETERRLP